MSIDPTTQHSVKIPAPLSTPESLDEKSGGAGLEIPETSVASDAGSSEDQHDCIPSEAEDRAVRRKLDLVVMPMLFLGFYVFQVSPAQLCARTFRSWSDFDLQLERGNISNALTDNFLVDVGITQDQFNTGQALLYLGIILLEIPSNYCLQLLGPSIWISFQVFAFGLVATLQSFQKGYGGYLASRIMLGVVECGYIPGTLGEGSVNVGDLQADDGIPDLATGSLYVISTFYKRSELAARNSFFFLGSGLASATTGLLAYGILPLGDRFPSRHGWQWMMISE